MWRRFRLPRAPAIALAGLFALCLSVPAAMAEPRAFVAVETGDIERSQAWYASVFEAELVNSFSRPTYEQRILRSDDLIVELVQRIPPREAGVPDRLGLMKSGVVVDDFAARFARWQAEGVTMLGRRIHDDALGLDTILLRDPDGNLIQVFGRVEEGQ
jgi:catechol 2,3-dioxygenase-like lactoylglutathione lyase family enzyme